MSFSITKRMISDLKHMLDLLNISYIQSIGESDSQLSSLYNNGLIDYIISEDTDIIVFGGNNLIRGFVTNIRHPYQLINIDPYMKNNNIQKLLNLSTLLGTDYNTKIHGIGIKRAINLVNKFDKIEDILIFLNEKNKINEFNKTINYYNTTCKCILENQQRDKEIDKSKLEKYLINYVGLEIRKIKNILEVIN